MLKFEQRINKQGHSGNFWKTRLMRRDCQKPDSKRLKAIIISGKQSTEHRDGMNITRYRDYLLCKCAVVAIITKTDIRMYWKMNYTWCKALSKLKCFLIWRFTRFTATAPTLISWPDNSFSTNVGSEEQSPKQNNYKLFHELVETSQIFLEG